MDKQFSGENNDFVYYTNNEYQPSYNFQPPPPYTPYRDDFSNCYLRPISPIMPPPSPADNHYHNQLLTQYGNPTNNPRNNQINPLNIPNNPREEFFINVPSVYQRRGFQLEIPELGRDDKKIIQLGSEKNGRNLKSKINVLIRPLRKKGIKYSDKFPGEVSSQVTYQMVICYPKGANLNISFFLKDKEAESKNKFLKVKEFEKLTYKDRSRNRSQKKILESIYEYGYKDNEFVVYKVKIQNIYQKELTLCLVDKFSGTILYESNSFYIYSRRRSKENLFWKKYMRNDEKKRKRKDITLEHTSKRQKRNGS